MVYTTVQCMERTEFIRTVCTLTDGLINNTWIPQGSISLYYWYFTDWLPVQIPHLTLGTVDTHYLQPLLHLIPNFLKQKGKPLLLPIYVLLYLDLDPRTIILPQTFLVSFFPFQGSKGWLLYLAAGYCFVRAILSNVCLVTWYTALAVCLSGDNRWLPSPN